MSSQFTVNFAVICRDKFSPSWIPRYLFPVPIPDIRRHNKGRPSEMSREIVPVEFINFLWGILIVLICWPPREGTPPASRIRRHRGGKGYDGIRSFNLQDRSLSRPSGNAGDVRWRRIRYVRYPKTNERISPHLQPSAECWFSLAWVKWVACFISEIIDLRSSPRRATAQFPLEGNFAPR